MQKLLIFSLIFDKSLRPYLPYFTCFWRNLWQSFGKISDKLLERFLICFWKNLITSFWKNFWQASKGISDKLLGRVLKNPTSFWKSLWQAFGRICVTLSIEVLANFRIKFKQASERICDKHSNFLEESPSRFWQNCTSFWKNLWQSLGNISNKISEEFMKKIWQNLWQTFGTMSNKEKSLIIFWKDPWHVYDRKTDKFLEINIWKCF